MAERHKMTGKRMASRAVRLLGVGALATWLTLAAESPARAGGAWTNQAATPPARVNHAMASPGGGQALLFGGYGGSSLNAETWLVAGFGTATGHRAFLPLVLK